MANKARNYMFQTVNRRFFEGDQNYLRPNKMNELT